MLPFKPRRSKSNHLHYQSDIRQRSQRGHHFQSRHQEVLLHRRTRVDMRLNYAVREGNKEETINAMVTSLNITMSAKIYVLLLKCKIASIIL